jgi:RimJ/RimL family protein N-acetyltransferase
LRTPTLTHFMAWDPSPSLAAFAEIWRGWLPKMAAGTDLALTIRLQSTGEFMGMAGLLCIGQPEPEIGIWIKEAAHGAGYGREAVAAVVAWHSRETVRPVSLIWWLLRTGGADPWPKVLAADLLIRVSCVSRVALSSMKSFT